MDLILLKKRIDNVIPKIDRIVLEVLDENENFIRELINNQMSQGKKKGGTITPQYSKAYAKKKGFSIPDLFVNGVFYSDIFTEVKGDILSIDADTKTKGGFELAKHLEKRYTSQIYELTSESITRLKKEILPKIAKRINDEIYR